VRRLNKLIAFAGAVGLACASMGAPPGGPQRKVPPTIVKVMPESGAVNVRDKSVVFEFDAIVSDNAGRSGDLANAFLISPHDDGTSVGWHRERIEVRPKRGFRPNTAYTVTLLPGIADLNNNVMRVGKTITFSTGASIPEFAVHGRVFDWLAERIAVDAVIDVVRRSDSLPYVGLSDSSGQFTVGPLEPGSYFMRAFIDNNHNRVLDQNELWDTVGTSVTATSPFVELRAVQRDTIAPRLLTLAHRDSLTLTASFDRLLDPLLPLTPTSFRIQASDSSPLTVARIRTPAQDQALRAATDSMTRDSIARAGGVPPVAAPSVPAPERVPGTVSPPKPLLPAPTRDVIILLDERSPLRAGLTYRVTALNARGLLGPVHTSDRVITIPLPDTTTAPLRKP
jgi:hypothetical protein